MNELIISPDEVAVSGVIVESIDAEYLGPQWPWYKIRVKARRAGGPIWENHFTTGVYGLDAEGHAEIVRVIRNSLDNLPEVPIE